jgi:hypothetical protein
VCEQQKPGDLVGLLAGDGPAEVQAEDVFGETQTGEGVGEVDTGVRDGVVLAGRVATAGARFAKCLAVAGVVVDADREPGPGVGAARSA